MTVRRVSALILTWIIPQTGGLDILDSAAMNFQIGDTIGDYQIVDVLGRGGMGKLFRVRNLISERVDALKIVAPDLGGNPNWPTASCARSRSMPAWSIPTSPPCARPCAWATSSPW